MIRVTNSPHRIRSISNLSAAALLAVGCFSGGAVAEGDYPTEHKGLTVETLTSVPAESISAQLGLDDRILLARRITIAPGGQIARHGHESIPGIVFMESGTWTEGGPDGETVRSEGDAFIEDVDTVHWFFNTSDEPATALVFDIRPPS